MWIICYFLSVIYIIYYIIVITIPFSPCDLGMKILIGLGGLGKAFNNINLHVIP